VNNYTCTFISSVSSMYYGPHSRCLEIPSRFVSLAHLPARGIISPNVSDE
jgi:hypothetical protein